MIEFIPNQVLTAEELNSAFAEVALGNTQMLITPHDFVGNGVTNSFPLTVTPFSLDYVLVQIEAAFMLSDCLHLSEDIPPRLSFNTPPTGRIKIRVLSAVPGGTPSTGDMTKAVYDPDDDGKIAYEQTEGVEASLAPGSTDEYYRGDKTWQSLGNGVRSTILTGLSLVSSVAVDAADTILIAFGKLQAQLAGKQATLVSTENIKTINGSSILGSGDLTVGSGGGTGTVTHTVGELTANQIIVGNGLADVKTLGGLGTASTVLHGNAAGAPTFGAVDLIADVTGILPVVNGGTGSSTDTKQVKIQFQDEGLALGPAGTVDTVNLTGPGVSSARTGNTVTITVAGGGSSGVVPILDWDGVEITLASGVTINDLCITELTTDSYLAFYTSGAGFYCVVLTVVGLLVSAGTPLFISAAAGGYNSGSISCVGLSATSAIISWRDSGSVHTAYAVTVSGTTVDITGATAVNIDGNSVNQPCKLLRIGTNKFIALNYATDTFIARVGTVSGNVVTYGAISTTTIIGIDNLVCCTVATDKVLVVTGTNAATANTPAILAVTGTTIARTASATYEPIIAAGANQEIIPQGSNFGVVGFAGTDVSTELLSVSGTSVSVACIGAVTVINTPLFPQVIGNSIGRGFHLLCSKLTGTFRNTYAYNMDYQCGPSLVRNTSGQYMGTGTIHRIGGTGVRKLYIFQKTGTTLSGRVLQERLV